MHAFKLHDLVMVKALIVAGADLNGLDPGRWSTPLCSAVENGYWAITELLIEKGADVNGVGLEGRTPLHYAARKGDEKSVTKLIEHGARTDLKDAIGQLAIDFSKARKDEKIVKILND